VLNGILLRNALVIFYALKSCLFTISVFEFAAEYYVAHSPTLHTGCKGWLGRVCGKSSSDRLQGQLLLSIAGVCGRIFETDAIQNLVYVV
jgi:hypothetical protein